MKRSWIAWSCLIVTSAAVMFFVQQMRIDDVRTQMIRESLRADFAASRFVLRFHKDGVVWSFDQADPIQASTIDRIQRVLPLTDAGGGVLEQSEDFIQLGVKPPTITTDTRFWEAAHDGKRYVLCTGKIVDSASGRTYQITIGRTIT